MEKEDKVMLLGIWASPYTKRVELGLKLKGIPYEYKEEDMFNKSPSVFKYNPVYKRLPVLVHNGNPIVESAIILQYIDETWQNGPRIVPDDPYRRAKARFWDKLHSTAEGESIQICIDPREELTFLKENKYISYRS
ncbi:hypothetical protein PTKIN_Ptkin17bG0119700 [Pterospermum kingtungense]